MFDAGGGLPCGQRRLDLQPGAVEYGHDVTRTFLVGLGARQDHLESLGGLFDVLNADGNEF